MAISGIGSQVTGQFAPRTAESREKIISPEPQNKLAVQANTVKSPETNTTLFTPVPANANSSKNTSSRRDLAEVETIRNRFQLQKEGGSFQGESGRALQSFIDVADFERKDELTNLVGIDLFV
jgi:hypothetical protein